MKEMDEYEKRRTMEIGVRIKEARDYRRMSGQQLSHMIGISLPHLYNYELGKQRIKDSVLKAIAIKLNVEYEWLLTGDPEKKFFYSKEYDEILDLFNTIPNEDREYVLEKMRNLL